MRNRCGSITVFPQASNSMRTPGPASSTLRLSGGHQPAVGFGRIEKIQDVGLVKSRQLAQRTHRCAHVRALQGAKESHRDADRFGHLSQRQAAAQPAIGAGAHRWPAAAVGRRTHQAFALEQLRNGGRIQPAHFAQESRALQQFHVFGRIQAVLLTVRWGRVRPRLSQERITDGETPTRRATSPIFK